MGALTSFSKSTASFGLHASEIALLGFGLLLVVGLVGEYAKSEKWKRRERLFELMVIVGVAGELIADGGMFLFSEAQQSISDLEVARLKTVRHFNPTQRADLIARLKPFSGQRVSIFADPSGIDVPHIAEQLASILSDAKWDVAPIVGERVLMCERPGEILVWVGPASDPSPILSAGKELVAGLAAEHFDVTLSQDSRKCIHEPVPESITNHSAGIIVDIFSNLGEE